MKYKKLQILNNIRIDTNLVCSILKKHIHKGLYKYDSIKSKYFKIKDVASYDKKYLAFRCVKCNYNIGSVYVIPLKHIIDGSTIFVVEKR